jgi:hypothetical protein
MIEVQELGLLLFDFLLKFSYSATLFLKFLLKLGDTRNLLFQFFFKYFLERPFSFELFGELRILGTFLAALLLGLLAPVGVLGGRPLRGGPALRIVIHIIKYYIICSLLS